MTVFVGLMFVALVYACRNIGLLHCRIAELEKRVAGEKKVDV